MVSSRDFARTEFLHAIKSHAPAVLSSLESDALPLYESISENITVVELATWHEELAEMSRLEFVGDERGEKEYLASLPVSCHPNARFEIALCKWGKCYHLTDKWIFSEALKTLEMWQRSGPSSDWACAREEYQPDVEMYEDERAFHFTFDPWDAALDTRASFKKKVCESFKAWLEDYCERTEESHGGDNKAYDSRKPDHYVWLVEHQINGLRYEDVAQKYQSEKGLDTGPICEAVTRLAKMLGLTLRPARRRSAKKRSTKRRSAKL